jgi:predicted peroxiredoxin
MTQTLVSDPGAPPSGRLQTLITIVTTAEPQTQAMAMVLTLQAAGQGGRVQLLLCGPAGDLALKEAPASATTGLPPKGASPQGLMQMIRDKTGATIEVCALYLPGKGMDASALLDGVTVADPATMAAQLMAADTRVLSF